MTHIPRDFLDIDADPDHWIEREYGGKGYIIPATEAGNDRLSDMTDAMMSEIPGMDDTVQPLKLQDNRFWGFCMAFLMQDGNLGVPGGRYGSNTRDCAEVAILMAVAFQYHQGEPITYYSLNSDMGLVVNGGDGVTMLLSESQYIFDESFPHDEFDVKYVLGDAYEPQTKLERLAKWAEVDIQDDNVTITFYDEDADKLIDAILANEAPFDLNE